MWILDTDHYSEFARSSEAGLRLRERMIAAGDEAFLTVVTAEEVMKGWLAAIQPHRQPDRGVRAYRQFQDSLRDLARWDILPWSVDSAALFDQMRKSGIQIGSLDLRISCIALEYEAVVLTRNTSDFRKVPNLEIENWLD